MNGQENSKSIVDQISSHVLDLMLDVVLEVMQAEHGSIMLLDDSRQELTIRSARGLKNDIIKKTRVRLGSGVSGKVAASGESVFLKGVDGERRLNINGNDLVKPEIDTSYITPIRLYNGTLGALNINSTQVDHGIRIEKERLVKGILDRFYEHLSQIDMPIFHHEKPSQLYMMNIFREYNVLRELRAVFDFVFHLITDLLEVKKKGVFFLKNSESGFFDLVLGYGLDTIRYREIYEVLLPSLKEKKIESTLSITIFSRREFILSSEEYFQEAFFILIPMVWRDKVQGQLLLFADEHPLLNDPRKDLLQSVCTAAAKTIEESASGQKFIDMAFTDSLTGTYNYGLWWKRLHEEFSRAQRLKDSNMSVLVLDIDHFDRINRTHGYLVGDQLLRVIADRIKGCLRIIDMVGRIGGEEFGVVLPDTAKHDAFMVAERILDDVSFLQSEIKIQLEHPLTLSGGVAAFPDDADTPEKLVEMAKTVLVSAKIMGGNRVRSFEHFEE